MPELQLLVKSCASYLSVLLFVCGLLLYYKGAVEGVDRFCRLQLLVYVGVVAVMALEFGYEQL